ncbi:MAG: tryptophanyl-tRNA synthetase [Cognaticolwellia sp.]|jgi:tryptophanyl-tRNA synthetase
MVRALTGIQPSGSPHIGNLKGMVEPAVKLQESTEPFYFIASYHAMTTLKDPELFRQYQLEAAATFLAFGLDPKRAALFLQQDVPEVCELSWILGTHINLGILERAHAFKSAKDKGKEINLGTFAYPVLMAADILLYDTNLVPVGKDQKQHVEMARDFAAGFNHRYGEEIFALPEPVIRPEVATVPGVDGQKMSKSYGNTLGVFTPPKKLRKRVMKVVTDSKELEEPKDPDSCNVFALYALFATNEEQAELADRYRAGGMGYGHAKQALFEVMDRALAEPRERFTELMQNPKQIEQVLEEGAAKARSVAQQTMERVRSATGLGPRR